MQNGNSFYMFMNETAELLATVDVVGYYSDDLPTALDAQMQQIVQKFTLASAAEREQLQAALPADKRSLFGIYGHRAATLAARQTSEQWLRSGLVGFAMANFAIPERRKVEVSMAIYYHVAQKLGLNPVELFEDTAVYAAPDIAQALLAFGRRHDVSLSRYGWQELKTADGVKYKFNYG